MTDPKITPEQVARIMQQCPPVKRPGPRCYQCDRRGFKLSIKPIRVRIAGRVVLENHKICEECAEKL